MTASSDSLPPMQDASLYCNWVALTMNAVSKLEAREPTVDIATFDAERGDEDFPDPLTTAHRLAGVLLQCGGEFVYSIGKLLELEEPMVMSPAVLARSAAEYASPRLVSE